MTLLRHLVDAVLLRKDAYVWMVFDARATGDALLVVAGVYGVWIILGLTISGGGLSLDTVDAVLRLLVQGGFAWILASAAAWAMSQFVLGGGGRFATTLPVVGFANAPIVIVPFLTQFADVDPTLARLLGGIGMAIMVARGAEVALELQREKAALAALVAAAVWYVVLF